MLRIELRLELTLESESYDLFLGNWQLDVCSRIGLFLLCDLRKLKRVDNKIKF